MGVTERQLRDLPSYQTSDAFTEAERLAIDLAVAMAKNPVEIPSELIVRLRAHFDQSQLIELAAAIAWEHYRARFNRVFGVRPSGFSGTAFCALPERSPKP